MAENHHGKSSDMGAAFAGLIGGALFIGAILYAIVLWTNSHFAGEAGAEHTGSISVPAASAPLVG